MPLCRVRIISSHNYLIHQKYIFLQVVFHLLAIFFVGPKQKKPDRKMNENLSGTGLFLFMLRRWP